MEVCSICGRKNPIEGANFCYYCGASLREHGVEEEDVKAKTELSAQPETSAPAETTDVTRVKRPFTTLHWLGLLLLLLIPPYGWIAFLVIALISAFGANATEERRAFAKAFLIFAVVLIVLMSIIIYSNPEMVKQYQEQYNKMLNDMQSGTK
jgi:hypothetical protein